MTMNAKRKTVGDVIPQVGELCPRLDMVRVQSAAALSAGLASKVVTLQHAATKCDVTRSAAILVPECGYPSFPVWMRSANERFGIVGRAASCALTAPADGKAVLVRERSSSESFRNRLECFLSALGVHHVCVATLRASKANLLYTFWTLHWIVSQIAMPHLARVSAKLGITPTMRTTLYAN